VKAMGATDREVRSLFLRKLGLGVFRRFFRCSRLPGDGSALTWAQPFISTGRNLPGGENLLYSLVVAVRLRCISDRG